MRDPTTKEVMEFGPRDWFLDGPAPEAGDSVLIDFNYILETGGIPSWTGSNTDRNQYIDWDADDAFTQALAEIEDNVIDAIAADSELQTLLLKDNWTFDDRVVWESRVSALVNEAHSNVLGLEKYRHEPIAGIDFSLEADRRAIRVNDLSEDIENGTANIEHDCETMSIVEGVVMQSVENLFLATSFEDEGNYKNPATFYYATGVTNNAISANKEGLGHAFIVSGATMSVIEATAVAGDGNQYVRNLNPSLSFEEFVAQGGMNGTRSVNSIDVLNNASYRSVDSEVDISVTIQNMVEGGVIKATEIFDAIEPDVIFEIMPLPLLVELAEIKLSIINAEDAQEQERYMEDFADKILEMAEDGDLYSGVLLHLESMQDIRNDLKEEQEALSGLESQIVTPASGGPAPF